MSKYSTVINDSVPMTDIIQRYLPSERIVGNRIRCPFHNGHDRNLSLKDTCWTCWVCHEKGNNIKFVSLLFNESTAAAEKRINDDFNLCLPISDAPLTLKQQREAMTRLKELKFKQLCKEMSDEAKSAHHALVWNCWTTLNHLRLEALHEKDVTGEYPEWAEECFKQWLEIDQLVKEGGDTE